MAHAPGNDERAPTEWVGSGAPPPDAGSGVDAGAGGGGRRGSRRGLVIGAAAGAAVLLGGGAVVAMQVLGGGGEQPADVLPASALGYVRIDLDPSANQKVNAVRLLRSVPEFESETGITADTDDLRRRAYEELIRGQDGCPSYADGVEGWIGERVGMAAMPPEGSGDPEFLVVVQVSDPDAAREGITEIVTCSEGGDKLPGMAEVGDYLLLAETQALADEFADEAIATPLSGDEGYQADMDALGDQGIVSGWVDVAETVDRYASESDLAEMDAAGLSGLGSMSMAMRAGSDHLELEVQADGLPVPAATAAAVGRLPQTTMLGLGFTGGSDAVDKGWSELTDFLDDTQPGGAGELTDSLEQAADVRLPDDLKILLGDDFALGLDSGGLALDPASGAPDPLSVRLGLRTSSGIDEVSDLVERLQPTLAQLMPLKLVALEADEGSVVATGQEHAEQLANPDAELADSDTYTTAVPQADDALGVLYADFDQMSEVAERLTSEGLEGVQDSDLETLERLRAFGASVATEGDYTSVNVRLVFD